MKQRINATHKKLTVHLESSNAILVLLEFVWQRGIVFFWFCKTAGIFRKKIFKISKRKFSARGLPEKRHVFISLYFRNTCLCTNAH